MLKQNQTTGQKPPSVRRATDRLADDLAELTPTRVQRARNREIALRCRWMLSQLVRGAK